MAFILLTPMTAQAKTITKTYDFSNTNQGVDSFAYRYQQNSGLPPIVNNVPNTEFTAGEYDNIEFIDGNTQQEIGDINGYYVGHRFVFNIVENLNDIVNISISWWGNITVIGGGASHGFQGFLWNWTTSSYVEGIIRVADGHHIFTWYNDTSTNPNFAQDIKNVINATTGEIIYMVSTIENQGIARDIYLATNYTVVNITSIVRLTAAEQRLVSLDNVSILLISLIPVFLVLKIVKKLKF